MKKEQGFVIIRADGSAGSRRRLHGVDGMSLTAWTGDDPATATKLTDTGGAVTEPIQYTENACYLRMEYAPSGP